MQVVICPGIHPPALTTQFLQALSLSTAWIYPAPEAPAYSGGHILAFILRQLDLKQLDSQAAGYLRIAQTPILLIGFSAGVVGATTAAYLWQALGGPVLALIAIDGWGMPLWTTFPVYRFSHDPFTHWSSALCDIQLDAQLDTRKPAASLSSFYADPAVGHLNFWRAPQTVEGWAVSGQDRARYYSRSNAAELLRQIIAGA